MLVNLASSKPTEEAQKMHLPRPLQMMGILWVFFGAINARPSGCSGGCSGGSTIIGPSDPGATIQGPGSQANIIGPDGGRISANEVGGRIYVPPKQGKYIFFDIKLWSLHYQMPKFTRTGFLYAIIISRFLMV